MNFELRNSFSVIPAKAGIQNLSAFLDPRVKPEDDKRERFVIQSILRITNLVRIYEYVSRQNYIHPKQ